MDRIIFIPSRSIWENDRFKKKEEEEEEKKILKNKS